MRTIRKFLVVLLVAVMILSSSAIAVSAKTEENVLFSVGDVMEFGEYPQSQVTEEALVEELNNQELNWISYDYYSGNGDYGSAVKSDYMKYADIEFSGEKYRAVMFTQYRPDQSEHDFENGSYMQQSNGYAVDIVYWFKFEPIKWRVLNPDTGLVICETILDSQPFQNEVYYKADEFMFSAHYADAEFTIPANAYISSSLKVWLEEVFTETAFSQTEESLIYQNAHLISIEESTNTDYGFDADKQAEDIQRMRNGSDYAKVQGLQIHEDEVGAGNSFWWLGDEVSIYQLESAVCYSGSANRAIGVSCTYIGVCPAININLSEIEYDFIIDTGDGTPEKYTYKYGQQITETEEPTREKYVFKGWDTEFPATMPAADTTIKAIWAPDTSVCRIRYVGRVTKGVTNERIAAYTITAESGVSAIQFSDEDTTFTFNRKNSFISGNLTKTGVLSITAYDINNDVLTAEQVKSGAEVSYEIWKIAVALSEGDYKVRTRVEEPEETWELINCAYVYTMVYDMAEVDESMVVSATPESAISQRAVLNPVTIVTSDKVLRLRITTTFSDGTSRILSYSPTSTSVEYTDNGDGTANWILNTKFTYSDDVDEQVQKWTVWYRASGDTSWKETAKTFEVMVTKYDPFKEEEFEIGYAPYTITDVIGPETAVVSEYTEIIVKTTDDVTKIRVTNENGISTTYMATSANINCVDNGDGTLTWTVRYRFSTAGTSTWGVQCRGSTWSAITDAERFVVTVTEKA